MKINSSQFFLALLVVVAVSWPGVVDANECSPQIGHATINEVHRQANKRFIEIKILNQNLNSNVYNSWSVSYCGTAHPGGRVCRTFPLTEFDQSQYPWLVLNQSKIPTANEINFGHATDSGMEIRLNDANGRAIDYLSISGYTDIHEISCDFQFDTTYNGSTNTHTVMRYPDGTGDWTLAGPGHSGGITEGDTNLEEDENNPYPRINITNIVVMPGNDAVFTIQLFDINGNAITLSHDVTVSFMTMDGEDVYGGATAPADYTYTEGEVVIPAGQNTVTVSVPTEPTALPDSFFYLVLTDAVQNNTDADPVVLVNHFASATFQHTCEGIFSGGVQSHSNQGQVIIEWAGQIAGQEGTTIDTTSVQYDPYSVPSCETSHCEASGQPAGTISMPSFQHSSGTVDVSLSAWPTGSEVSSYSLGSGGTNYYRDITSTGNEVEISDSGNFDIYYIRTMRLHYQDVLRLRAGTVYWIENLEFTSSDNRIEVIGSGTATLYVKNDVAVPHRTLMNATGVHSPSSPDKLAILTYGSWLGGDSEVTVSALLYVAGNLTTGYNALYHGAVSAGGTITVTNSSTIEYVHGAVVAESVQTFCEGQEAGEFLLDHLRLLHDGQGITCMAETITVRACADADCDELYPDEVTVGFTSPGSGWSQNPVTFSGGTATVELGWGVAGAVILAAEATAPAAENPTQCENSGGGAACELIFAEAGILLDGNDGDAASKSDIPVQIAGKPSGEVPGESTQRVRVIRTDTETGACVAGVGNETLSASFSYLVPTSLEGLADNTIAISGESSANLTAAASPQNIQLNFHADGTAPFSFTSQDAGRYQLQVDLNIPVTDADGLPTGEVIPAHDTSNDFIVRPLALFADATSNPKAQDAGGLAFKKAGDSFLLTFKALRWSAVGSGEGEWVSCGDPEVLDPGDYIRVPTWSFEPPSAYLVAPSGGVNPALNYPLAEENEGEIEFAGDEYYADHNPLEVQASYNEVGIIQFSKKNEEDELIPAKIDFLDLEDAVTVCSPYIGRFTPDHFVLSADAVTNRSIEGCALPSPFTYMGEPFEVSFTLRAENAAYGPTENYAGDFAKFDHTGIGAPNFYAGAVDTAGPTQFTGRFLVTEEAVLLDPDWLSGEATFTLEVSFARDDSTLDGPYENLTVGVAPQDGDGVSLAEFDLDVNDDDGIDDHGAVGSTEVRYGRLRLKNAYGSELQDLQIKLFAEYYSADGWLVNIDDSCTPYSDADAALSDWSGNLGEGETVVTGNGPVSSGKGLFSLSAPGAGNDGSVLLTLEEVPAYMQFDWNGEGEDVNPSAIATFGLYRGNDRVINWREIMR